MQSGRGMRCCMMNLQINVLICAALVLSCMASHFAVSWYRLVPVPPERECSHNLKRFAAAQTAFKAKHDRYGTTFAEIGFQPRPGGRCLYTMDATRLAATFVPAGERAWKVTWGLIPARAEGDVPIGPDTAVCVGNLDEDDEVDVWSVSTRPRVTKTGDQISAGTPWHDRADRERDKPERESGAW
jgi:type IV pilus assembly protein PilA